MIFRRDTVTLSFEGDCLRLLVASNGRVLRWDKRDLPPGLMDGDSVKQIGPLGDYLAKLFQVEDLSKSKVVSSVSGQRSIFRNLTLPPIEDKLLGNAVRRKVRQEIPMPGRDMEISHEVVAREGDQMTVFVVAVPKSVIESHVRAFQAAGVRLRALDVTPLALVRAANLERTIVVGMEDSGLSLVIVSDGMPAIVRTVPMASQLGSPESRLDLLLDELRRTTKFYNESHKQNPLSPDTPLVVSGSSFNDRDLRERLAASVDYPVQDPHPPLELPEELPVPEFSANLGLALKQL